MGYPVQKTMQSGDGDYTVWVDSDTGQPVYKGAGDTWYTTGAPTWDGGNTTVAYTPGWGADYKAKMDALKAMGFTYAPVQTNAPDAGEMTWSTAESVGNPYYGAQPPEWMQAQHPGEVFAGLDANMQPMWNAINYDEVMGGMGPLLVLGAAGLGAGLFGELGAGLGEAATLPADPWMMPGSAASSGYGAGAAATEAAAGTAATGLGSGLPAVADAGMLGSGISGTAGGVTGLTGTATGTLTGSVGALGSATGAAGLTGTIPGIGTLTAEGMLIPAAGGAAVALSSVSPSVLSSIANWASNLLGTPVSGAQIASGALSGIGGLLSGNAAQNAAQTSANAQIEAARIAADAARFKPVGVTTRFGQSKFTTDAQGNVNSAGYDVSPDIAAMRESLLGAAPGMLSQFTGSQAATAPMGTAAQRAMTLGNQYLATDPAAQAQKYYDDQQAVMATQRTRDQAGMLTGEFNRGTYGLATGGTGQMGAANPRLEAMYNAQRQQDLQLAANATQGGMDYAKFGAGMVGTGGDLLKAMYGTQSASYDPYKTAISGAQMLEGLGQNALDLSVQMGKIASPAQSGQLLSQGMLGAAQTMQPANAYSPWGAMLSGAGNAVANYTNPAVNQQYKFDPFTGRPL